jgi:hypothetical protein
MLLIMPIQPKGTSAETAAFMSLYYDHLARPDCPSARIAYARAEADTIRAKGRRHYNNYNTFKVCKSQHLRRTRLRRQKQQVSVYRAAG